MPLWILVYLMNKSFLVGICFVFEQILSTAQYSDSEKSLRINLTKNSKQQMGLEKDVLR